jgi:Ca2+-binding RTX toxin-like protein
MFKLNKQDLAFVLKQIKIGEAHANGTPLTEIRLDASGNVITDRAWYENPSSFNAGFARAIPDAKAPYGIRTVDGSYNNLVEGREMWGAAGQGMPRLLDGGAYLDENDGDTVMFGTAANPVWLTNNSYAPGAATGNPMLAPGTVADADPRIISNLVSDMSLNNPAAIVAALTFAGAENAYATLQAIQGNSASWAADLAVLLNPLATAAAKEAAQTNINGFLSEYGIEVDASGSLLILNVAPDEGLSAPFNSWMTFFGQFFDHGLDLISKGGAGTIYIPLSQDDPLYNPATPHTNFMVLTRSTNVPGEDAPTQRNVTTSWVDQNQTYTSHASHQVFLREYERDPDTNEVVASGRLLDGIRDGAKNGLPTWADVKAQAREMLGIELTDRDVGSVPLVRTDAYGKFIPDPDTGYAQLITGVGADGIPNTADDVTISGTRENPVNPTSVGAIRTDNAFLDDIAHKAVPVVTGGVLMEDNDSAVGYSGGVNARGSNTHYDDELLDRHFITGDGRGNENIGLTAVHHVFHSEHNRQIELQKATILGSGDLDFINEWLREPITSLAEIDSMAEIAALEWNGERLFQAGRMATEMQYQHLVFEEFGRKIQPAIDPFVFNSVTDIDPSIFSEFANVIYRFGHSMLTDTMPRIHLDADGNVASTDDMGLIGSFLNPVAFNDDGALTAEQAAGAIIRGMTIERGNEIDEFLTGALRNNLLGIPLDLAAINIARGRDTNMPTLNEAREQLYAASGSTFLTPYESWSEFAANLKNPMSVVNFIAAYGKHASLEDLDTVAEKREAAMKLVFGGDGAPADRIAFLNSTGAYNAGNNGLNDIDLWIGGLAEKKMPFGGFLGSTFNAVFEAQMENLQDGDRFYYLSRTQGQNFLNELEQNSFAKMIMANTDITNPGPDGIRGTGDDIITRHIGVDSFATYDYIFEVNAANQADYNGDAEGVDPSGNDPVLEALGKGKVVRNDPGTPGNDTNYFRTFGGEHVVVGGTNENDTIITDFGDDGIWGDGGNDRIESGAGVDLVNGGAGNDIITDSGDTGDFLKGDAGDDVIANSNGLDVIMGGTGKDVVFVGVDDTEVFGGEGDDFILGGDGVDNLMGNEGDDWIEGGGGFDGTAGDNSELFFNSKILGHDVMMAGSEEHDFDAESGDDIMVQGESVMRNEGMWGFDWATYKGSNVAADADMTIRIFTTEEQNVLRNRFDQVEGLSGWDKNDVLRGDSRTNAADAGTEDLPGAGLPETRLDNNELSHAGLDRIDGLRAMLSDWVNAEGPAGSDREKTIAFEGGNIILGGGGSDVLEGRGGNDVLDGDKWLNVRIRITEAGEANTADNQIATIDSLKHTFASNHPNAQWAGKSLFQLMIDRVIEPSQLHIVREVVKDDGVGDTDVAVYWDVRANYTATKNADGSVTLAHTGFNQNNVPASTNFVSDGTDKLWNIEKARFADGEFTIQQLLNVAASGGPTLSDVTPTETQALTASPVGIIDPNGLPSTFAWQWQVSTNNGATWTNIASATGASFTPTQAQVGAMLRVEATFTDNGGVVESVFSAATSVVGDSVTTGNGNNTLTGTAGDDILTDNGFYFPFLSPARDTLNGGLGADTMAGGNGDDTYVVDNLGDVVTEAAGGSSGNDTVQTSLATYTLATNVEELTFVAASAGTAFNWTGNASSNRITSGNGNDTITGAGGNDTLQAGNGNDALAGGDGNDSLDGGGGTDTAVLSGPSGNYGFGLSGTSLLVTSLLGADGNDTLAGVEQIDFNGTVLTIRAGTAANNTVNGANNVADLVLGFGGNDVLNGLSGNDVLVGGTGRDTMTGGLGNDKFLFSTAAEAGNGTNATTGRDVITDFVRGQDLIDLSGIDANAALGGNNAFTFIGGSAFTGLGQVRAFTSGTDTIIQGNVSGTNANVEFEIQLTGTYTGANALAANDFIL